MNDSSYFFFETLRQVLYIIICTGVAVEAGKPPQVCWRLNMQGFHDNREDVFPLDQIRRTEDHKTSWRGVMVCISMVSAVLLLFFLADQSTTEYWAQDMKHGLSTLWVKNTFTQQSKRWGVPWPPHIEKTVTVCHVCTKCSVTLMGELNSSISKHLNANVQPFTVFLPTDICLLTRWLTENHNKCLTHESIAKCPGSLTISI